MSTANIEKKNAIIYVVGMALILVGVVSTAIGGLYVILIDIVKNPLVSVTTTDDAMIRWVGTQSYLITYVGLAIFCLGMCLKWRAEDNQDSLESTTRFVGYDELRSRQAARRHYE